MRPITCLIFSLFFLAILSNCNRRGKSGSPFFNPASLPSFTVEIDISRDTTIQAPGGSIIHIPANALDAGGANPVKLVIREALQISDIIEAGLLTRSHGQILSSGGMIDIEAADGQKVKVTSAIDVSIPASYLEKNMQVYKGEIGDDGGPDWVDPRPLPADPQIAALDTGMAIFQSNCASCHRLDKYVTGPSLAYISRRRDRNWLYAFTKNNTRLLGEGDRYANCLYEQYNKTAMNLFFNLTDAELDALYRYIDNESSRLALPVPSDHLFHCVDSCAFYDKERDRLIRLREKLIEENGERVSQERRMPAGYVSADTGTVIYKVQPPKFKSVYYRFAIKSFGWYNIDIVLNNLEGVKESQLSVRFTGSYNSEVSAFLVIPSAMAFQEGGPLEGKENEYGFYTEDGKIALPQGVNAVIIAVSERDGKLLFGMSSFQIAEKQLIKLAPMPVTKEQMNASLRSLDLKGIDMHALDAINADSIRKTDKQLKDIEKLRPRTCDCNCSAGRDTVSSPGQ
jgi:mono/diheme cytochrome c family protein